MELFPLDPHSQLLNALQDRDTEAFEKLLECHTDINHVYNDPYHGSLLDIACRDSELSEFVPLLIQYGANTNLVNETHGKAPLHFAVELSDPKTLQYLLENPGIDVNIEDKTGRTALHLACQLGKPEHVKLLLAHETILVNALNNEIQTPIQQAIMNKTVVIISELLKHKGIYIDFVDTLSKISLRKLIANQFPELVPILPDPGNVKSQLMCYVHQRDQNSVRKLLKYDPTLIDSYVSLIHSPVDQKNKEQNASMVLKTKEIYSKLHKSLLDRDIEAFEKLLECRTGKRNFDINHIYNDPYNGSLLDITCQFVELSDFVPLLIQYGANTNLVNEIYGKAPLHFAAELCDPITLQYLLDCPDIDVNIEDNTGGTVLHLACQLGKVEQVKLLLTREKIRVNALNSDLQTPMQLAILTRNIYTISELLKHKDIYIDSVEESLKCKISLREVISDLFPELVPILSDTGSLKSQIMCYLHQCDLNSFRKLLKYDPTLANSDDGKHTLFQEACNRGLYDFVDLLVRCGADINRTLSANAETGLMIACNLGYYKIVQLLINNASISLSPMYEGFVLHNLTFLSAPIFDGKIVDAEFLGGTTNEGRDYFECLKIILETASPGRLDIDQWDEGGFTALHYAAKLNLPKFICSLLEYGAYIGTKDTFGKSPLAYISPKTLETSLDRCIGSTFTNFGEPIFVNFKYDFLISPQRRTQGIIADDAIPDMESNEHSTTPDNDHTIVHLKPIHNATTPNTIDVIVHDGPIGNSTTPNNIDVIVHVEPIDNSTTPNNIDDIVHVDPIDNSTTPNDGDAVIYDEPSKNSTTSNNGDAIVNVELIDNLTTINNSDAIDNVKLIDSSTTANDDDAIVNVELIDNLETLNNGDAIGNFKPIDSLPTANDDDAIVNVELIDNLETLNNGDAIGNFKPFDSSPTANDGDAIVNVELIDNLETLNNGDAIGNFKPIESSPTANNGDVIVNDEPIENSTMPKNGNAIVNVKPIENQITRTSEIDPLFYMSQSLELRPLLKHPVLKSFILIKWHSIRWLFYCNLAFYATFWLLITTYILGYYNSSEFIRNKNNNTQPKIEVLLRYILVIFLGMLVLRELFQLFVSPVRYITVLVNWVELFLIITTGLILFGDFDEKLKNQISAIGIFLSWAELILLIGRHPSLSTKTEMFKTVSRNFLEFLAYYSVLILAFALSFHLLFKDAHEYAYKNDFMSPSESIFRIIVSLTGQFEAKPVPIDFSLWTSHILFVLFIFLISIVLSNLLNGLAVSDTQAIRKDAELVGLVSHVERISHIETILGGNSVPFRFPDFFFASYLNRLSERIFSFRRNLLPDSVLEIEIPLDKENYTWSELNPPLFLRGFVMDESIVKAAKEIVNKRRAEANETEPQQIDTISEEHGQKLQQVEKLLNEIKAMMKKK